MILWCIRPWPTRPTRSVRSSPAVGPSPATTSTSWAASDRHWSGSTHRRTRRARSWPETAARLGRAGPASVGAGASDECYGEFGWDAEPVSVLHPTINDGRHEGLLALHSLSKRSNLAGYRAGFVAGDDHLVAELLAVRKHAGMMVPAPIQAAMIDLARRSRSCRAAAGTIPGAPGVLRPALEAAGFRIDHSEGSLYLWATRDEDSRASVDFLARRASWSRPVILRSRRRSARTVRVDRDRRADRRRRVTTHRLRGLSVSAS